MANKEKIIEGLQVIVTDLAQQADGHAIQSRVFYSQGFDKLGEKYAEHAEEEMGWVDKFIDRIIDLGGQPKVEAAPAMPVTDDPVEYIKADIEVSRREVPVLMQLTTSLSDDFKTYDLLRDYALDEEEDMYWSEQQLELIAKIGLQNWLVKQL